MSDYKEIDLPRDCISTKLDICPLCNDTKSSSEPYKTTKMSFYLEYMNYCDSCNVKWVTNFSQYRM